VTAASWLALVVVAACALGGARMLGAARTEAVRRFLEPRGVRAGVAALLFFVILALAAPLVSAYGPAAQLDIVALQSAPPSWRHLLGTDLLSRDVWARITFGARVSLGIGALATAVSVGLGALVGGVAGYFRGPADAVLMRLVDVGLAVPRIFLVLAVLALGHPLTVAPLALLIGCTGWFAVSRIVRSEVLSLRERVFVEGARALGVRPWRILARHVLPGTGAVVIVAAALGVANAMLLEAGLSFLGVGVQPPVPSWGNMIADARDQLATAPWASLFPGLAITAVVVALHAMADGLRGALDPRGAPSS